MKIGVLLKLQTKLLRRRNTAQKKYTQSPRDPLNNQRVRLDQTVIEQDYVLNHIDRIIKNNQDRFHDRKKR